VKGPEGRNMRVCRKAICGTGGIVNAYRALQLAEQAAAGQKEK